MTTTTKIKTTMSRWFPAIACLGAALGLGVPAGRAADETPEEILEGRGLVKSGKLYLHTKGESEVMAKLNVVLPQVDRWQVLYEQFQANQEVKVTLANIDNAIIAANGRIGDIDATLPQIRNVLVEEKQARANLIQERAMLQAQIPELKARYLIVRKQLATQGQEQAHAREVKETTEKFGEAYAELAPVATRLQAIYNELKQDPKVSNAIKVIRQSTKVNVQLGPSPALQNEMTRVHAFKNQLNPARFRPQPVNVKKAKPLKR